MNYSLPAQIIALAGSEVLKLMEINPSARFIAPDDLPCVISFESIRRKDSLNLCWIIVIIKKTIEIKIRVEMQLV
jgi:hypothetical protein